MTGFGRGECTAESRTWTAEIRTVNHRFLDQRVVLPRVFNALEEVVKKQVSQAMDRGRVEITITQQGESTAGPALAVNDEVARQYHRCLVQLQQDYDLGGSITLSDMLVMRDVITQQEQHPDLETEGEVIRQAVAAALADCDTMREQEGQALKEDLLARLTNFTAVVKTIEEHVPEILRLRQEELETRIGKLLGGMDIDPLRLAQETAIMADKCDVTEEIVRLGSHIEQFHQFLSEDEPVGRRLDFLLQEFLREVNTLCSKINNAGIAHHGVELKNEIEKIREQVQNIE